MSTYGHTSPHSSG